MIKTKVIFRKWKDGSIIAIFPEVLGDTHPYTCNSYESIGQHGSCEPYHLLQSTKLAKESEYKDLARELTKIGYNLQIIKRNRYSFLETRRELLKEIT